jgi:hypothetical protein
MSSEIYLVTCTEGHESKRELASAQAAGIAGQCWCGRALFVCNFSRMGWLDTGVTNL